MTSPCSACLELNIPCPHDESYEQYCRTHPRHRLFRCHQSCRGCRALVTTGYYSAEPFEQRKRDVLGNMDFVAHTPPNWRISATPIVDEVQAVQDLLRTEICRIYRLPSLRLLSHLENTSNRHYRRPY